MRAWWWRVRFAFWWSFYTDLGLMACWRDYAKWVDTELMDEPPRDVAFEDIVSLIDPEYL